MSTSNPAPSDPPPTEPAAPAEDSSPNPFLSSQASTKPIKGGAEWWRRSFAYMTNMGMTPAERAEFEADRQIKKDQEQCRRCEDYVDWNLRYSPIVRFLTQNVTSLSPPLPNGDPSLYLTTHGSNPTIRCLPCNKYQSGGFSPSHGILICQNRLLSRKHAEDTLAHELVHMHDHLRFVIDWAGDLRHHACAEIRASSLSGECRWTREAFGRGVWDFTRQHQECVRRRATLSVMGHPLCKGEEHARKVVNQVFESCFADTRPFDEIYR